jgi:ribosomal protein L3 glutamine methyltransferase
VGNSSVALERAFPNVPFVWLEFAEGDSGVFLLTRQQLLEHRESFQ